jgi:hypothetical protein
VILGCIEKKIIWFGRELKIEYDIINGFRKCIK